MRVFCLPFHVERIEKNVDIKCINYTQMCVAGVRGVFDVPSPPTVSLNHPIWLVQFIIFIHTIRSKIKRPTYQIANKFCFLFVLVSLLKFYVLIFPLKWKRSGLISELNFCWVRVFRLKSALCWIGFSFEWFFQE